MATEREEMRVVADQLGAPTWCRKLARSAVNVVLAEGQRFIGRNFLASRSGTYHRTAAGQTSWLEFASTIVEQVRRRGEHPPWVRAAMGNRPLIVKRLVPIAAKGYSPLARRPAYSVLSNELLKQTFGIELPDWRVQPQTALGSQGDEQQPFSPPDSRSSDSARAH